MRWTRGTRSDDVEDRRGESGGGGFGRMRLGIGGFLVLLVLSLVFKKNFFALVGGGVPSGGPSASVGGPAAPGPATESAAESERYDFVNFVIKDVQDTWTTVLPAAGHSYERAKLVLFRDQISSACGFAESATGPFYCPGDHKVYLDLGFFDELSSRFGAPGDFAQAYVIAHEVGHHVQYLLGTEQQVRQAQKERPDLENELSVRMELQADCYAGVWGFAAARKGELDPDDAEEGLNAAAAIGDDRLQKAARGSVNPESFTHGTSRQRATWFRKGLESGSPAACDTFRARSL